MRNTNHILQIGAVLRIFSGESFRILRYIGKGGQGEVYEVEWRGGRFAFKFFIPGRVTAAQLAQLEVNIRDGSPSKALVFPLAAVVGNSGKPIGYLMELVSADFVTLADRINQSCNLTFHTACTAGIALAHSTRLLHAAGKVYCDFNLTNVMLQANPFTGAVKIIDPDNIIAPCEASGLVFTPNMAAPEILRDKILPNFETDLFSLAKLIFMLILGGDPFVGRYFDNAGCLSLETLRKLYGSTARFVFDPNDHSNRPDPGKKPALISNWKCLPDWFKAVFVRAFCDGHSDPLNRVRESEWLDHLIRLRDSIGSCKKCSAQVFLEGTQPSKCWACKAEVKASRIIRTDRSEIVLNPGTKLFLHHINMQTRYDVKCPVAEVVKNSKDKRVLGLKNLTDQRWVVHQTDGATKSVERGSLASLARGTKIVVGEEEVFVI